MKFTWNHNSFLSGKGFTLNSNELKKNLELNPDQRPFPKSPLVAIKLDNNPLDSITNLFQAVDGNYCFRLTPEPFPGEISTKPDPCLFTYQPATSPPCFIVQTGGTTGPVKQILRLQGTWIQSFKINKQNWSISTGDNYGILGDLTHSISLYGLLEGLYLGTNVTLLGDWLPKSQIKEIVVRKISVLYATPIQLQLLIRAFEIHQLSPIKSLRRVIVGGSKLSTSQTLKLTEMFPEAEVIEFYGTTETSFITVSSSNTPQGSVGKAYEGVDIRVTDDNRDLLPQNEIGNIEVASPYLFEGYIIEGKVSLKPNDYFQTGERGYLDDKGNLFLKGRRDRMISIHDTNIHPEEVENYLETLQGVEAAYVYLAPDKPNTHHLNACIYYNSVKPDINDIASRCRSDLGNYQAPKSYQLIDDKPPKLPSGKLDLVTIKARLGLE